MSFLDEEDSRSAHGWPNLVGGLLALAGFLYALYLWAYAAFIFEIGTYVRP